MRIVNDIKSKNLIKECMEALTNGELLVLPSDTVYGLAVDATNENAVKKLIAFKNRPRGKAISVYMKSLAFALDYVDITATQQELLQTLLPGPFTVVLNSKQKTIDLLEEQRTLGIRIPQFEFINILVQEYDNPITATSANLSGDSSHYSIQTLLNSLPENKKGMLDLIVDYGVLPRNKPSTVIDLTSSAIKTLRQGDLAISQKEIISHSETETKEIALQILKDVLAVTDKQPLILLQGELGVGKTIFTKGIGEYLGIQHLDSPSFVIYNEYELNNQSLKKLIHFDLYNIQKEEEFDYLGIDQYLKPENLMIFEWGEKAGYLHQKLKKSGNIIFVKMEYINEKERRIKINKFSGFKY